MKVWLLTEHYSYEGETPVAIFSSKGELDSYIKENYPTDSKYFILYVREVELNTTIK